MSERIINFNNGIVSNVRIYDLEECIKASGLPMKTEGVDYFGLIDDKDRKRIQSLIHAVETDNQAHGQFLTGIRVNFDLTFTNKAWVEAERYRFLEFVSSQSTMHRLSKFDLDIAYSAYVDRRVVEIMKELIADYLNEENPEAKAAKYLNCLYTNPSGFVLTARMTTNYRCLRNIYKQRKNHRLPEWRVFCRWIETLPYAKELLIN